MILGPRREGGREGLWEPVCRNKVMSGKGSHGLRSTQEAHLPDSRRWIFLRSPMEAWSLTAVCEQQVQWEAEGDEGMWAHGAGRRLQGVSPPARSLAVLAVSTSPVGVVVASQLCPSAR